MFITNCPIAETDRCCIGKTQNVHRLSMESALGMPLTVRSFPIYLEITSFTWRNLQSRVRFAYSVPYFSTAGFIYFVVYFVVLPSDLNMNIFPFVPVLILPV